MSDTSKNPIFFQENRVWRCYLGGLNLDLLAGHESPKDSHFPEHWLASTTIADNGPDQQSLDEGMSRLADSNLTLAQYLAANSMPPATGVLCKLLDSAVRLAVQCHPDREFSRKYLNSPYGKAEAWTILSTRVVNGQQPCLYMGFKPGVTKDMFRHACEINDKAAILELMHCFPVKTANEAKEQSSRVITEQSTIFIPGRFPHAIGPGVLLLESMEPSDWVFQPEKDCAGRPLSARTMWSGVDPEIALDCFNYNGKSAEETLNDVYCPPRQYIAQDGVIYSHIIDASITPCFTLDLVQLTAGTSTVLPVNPRPTIVVVIKGTGNLTAGNVEKNLKFGSYFLIPPSGNAVTVDSKAGLDIMLIRGQ